MKPRRRWFPGSIQFVAALASVLAVAFLSSRTHAQAGSDMKKLKREIRIMENVLDRVLVDSRSVLVPSQRTVRGAFLPELGAVFSLEFSLLDRHRYGWWKNFDVDSDGDRIVILRRGDDDEEDDEGGGRKNRDKRETRQDREKKAYEEAKEELLEALADHGGDIDGLSDTHWVVLSVSLRDSDYFFDNKVSQLIVKASVQDLKAHAEGRLSREALFKKIVQTEY